MGGPGHPRMAWVRDWLRTKATQREPRCRVYSLTLPVFLLVYLLLITCYMGPEGRLAAAPLSDNGGLF